MVSARSVPIATSMLDQTKVRLSVYTATADVPQNLNAAACATANLAALNGTRIQRVRSRSVVISGEIFRASGRALRNDRIRRFFSVNYPRPHP